MSEANQNRARIYGSEDQLAYMLAGNAKVTLVNSDTGNRFTYKISASKNQETGERDLDGIRFVAVLNGPDNWANYAYIGAIFDKQEFRHTQKSRVGETAPSFKVFDWVWRHMSELPENVEIYHEGQCGRCGRSLTVPESIERGLGPVCSGA